MNGRSTLLALGFCCLAHAGLAGAQCLFVPLSPDRARTFYNEDLSTFRPESFDNFGSAVAAGDFNGDGVPDLATGIPRDDGKMDSGCTDCGAVVVRYGVAGEGLETGLADDFLTQQWDGSPEPAELSQQFGYALAAGDFNGDGFDDLAVGIPFDRTVDDPIDDRFPGAVQIHYGQPGGVKLVGYHFLQPGANGVPFLFERSWTFGEEWFGSALAAGDFDGDGYDDLAIGSPEQRVPSVCGGTFCTQVAGAVLVARGGFGGVLPFHGYYMFQGGQGLPDTPESVDEFGFSVAAADFNGDGYDDLAIGVPNEDLGGAVLAVFGSPISLNFADHRFLRQSDLGRQGEAGDAFALTLATGDFDGDGFDDLAIGTPFEDITVVASDMRDAGAVSVLYGADSGFSLGRTQYIDQGFDEFADRGSFTGDVFGWALSGGDFDGDGRDDLAIGHPGENAASANDSGAVTVTMGSPWGLRFDTRCQISQGVGGFPGAPPLDNHSFGSALAVGDFDADGAADLAVGAPNEDAGGLAGVGTEMVIYGSR